MAARYVRSPPHPFPYHYAVSCPSGVEKPGAVARLAKIAATHQFSGLCTFVWEEREATARQSAGLFCVAYFDHSASPMAAALYFPSHV
jgi:hypothetical protein